FRQLHTGQANRVDALDLPGQTVEDQIAPDLLPVGQDLQQHQAAYPGKLDDRVIQRLGLVLHRLAVDAQAVFSVVFNLHRQVAADGLDEHGIDRKSTRLNSSHVKISYAVFCLKKKKRDKVEARLEHLRHHRECQN